MPLAPNSLGRAPSPADGGGVPPRSRPARRQLAALFLIGILLGLPWLRLALAATANFQNGSFELGYSGNTVDLINGPDSASIPGWSVAAGGSIELVGSGTWAASSGKYSLALDGNSPGAVAQTFATTAGQAYTLNFDLAGDYRHSCNGSNVKTVLVTAGATSQRYTFDTTGKSASNMGWVTNALSFTAAASSTTLTFASQDPGTCNAGAVIDNVRILVPISGTVFEDVNYGGGAGRSAATASAAGGSVRAGARVELYNAAGSFVSATTTNGSGAYSFLVDVGASYTVRVVDATVTSGRAGSSASVLGVQTYRTDASSGVAVAVNDHVGGENPALVDAASNTSAAKLASLTGASATPQSISTVAVGNAAVAGVDFGFNFDTIVNTAASGQGSLVQWVTNASAFTDQANLAQSGSRSIAGVASALPAGFETSIFMITNGSAVGGLRSGLASQLVSGYATISPAGGGLNLQGANVILDGATQTANVGNTNPGTTGSGGTVGTGAIVLAKFDLPEIQISMPNGYCLCTFAANDILRAFALSGGAITLGGNGSQVSDALVGMDALGNSNAGTVESGSYGITVGAASNVLVNHNYLKINNSGVRRDVAGANLTVQYNEIAAPYNGQSTTYDGVIVYPGSADRIQYNLIRNQTGSGFEVPWGGGTNLVFQQNTLSANGLLYGSSSASTEPGGIVIYGSIGTVSPQLTIAQNIITGSGGDAISILTGTGFKITQNSIYGNEVGIGGAIGIDFVTNGATDGNNYAPSGVMANTGSLNANLPNKGMNSPVFTAAGVTGATLGVIGYVGTAVSHAAFAGATVEIFKASPNASGHGDGSGYIGTLSADANGNFSGTLTVPGGVSLAIGDVLTATATDASGDTSEFGANFTINSPYNMSPGSFNAFETATAAGSVSGVIQTKIAGAAFGLDIVAVNAAGNAVYTTFTGTVTLQLLDASNNSGALNNTCRSSWVAIGGSSTVSFTSANNGRLTTSFLVANAYPNARVQMTFVPTFGSTVVSCSTDNFAIRPAALALLAASDSSWASAGSSRTLANVGASGGNVHKAGQPFTLSAQAQNAAGVLTSNYSGTTTAILTCVLPAGCGASNLGSLTFTPTLAGGVMASNDAVYSDVGSFTLQLVDTTFAAVDAADSTPAQRYVYSAAVNVGRFVPDHFALAVNTAGTQYTYGSGSCASRSFTYAGQPVAYKAVPVVGVTAQNTSNGTTANYRNELWKLTSASVSQSLADAGGHAVAATVGSATVVSNGNGTGTLSPNAGDTVTWLRSSTTPAAPYTAQAVDTFGVADTSEASGAIVQAAALAVSPSFDAGATMDYGRIALSNAYGVETQALAVPAETQIYTGSVWITNASDSCTAIPAAALAFGNWQKSLSACKTSVSGGGTVSRGRTSLLLSAPGTGNTGSVDLTLNLDAAASGSACVGGAAQPSTTTGLGFLQGAWGGSATYNVDPTGRASFGEYGVQPGFRREN